MEEEEPPSSLLALELSNDAEDARSSGRLEEAVELFQAATREYEKLIPHCHGDTAIVKAARKMAEFYHRQAVYTIKLMNACNPEDDVLDDSFSDAFTDSAPQSPTTPQQSPQDATYPNNGNNSDFWGAIENLLQILPDSGQDTQQDPRVTLYGQYPPTLQSTFITTENTPPRTTSTTLHHPQPLLPHPAPQRIASPALNTGLPPPAASPSPAILGTSRYDHAWQKIQDLISENKRLKAQLAGTPAPNRLRTSVSYFYY